MTDFQKKRLAYLIKSGKNADWVRLNKEDADALETLLQLYFGMYP